MADAESKALLMESAKKNTGGFEEQDNRKLDKGDRDHGWWASDSGSSSGSYYSDSDSSEVEWESAVEPNGELLYIESATETFSESKKVSDDESNFSPPELTRRRSVRAGKLMRLIKRKNSTRGSVRNKKSSNTDSFNVDKRNRDVIDEESTFSDFQAGEMYNITLWIDPSKRHKLGRRATMCEAYLGIIPGLMPMDNSKVVVTGFIPQEEASKCVEVKIGDWIRSINSRDVTSRNLDSILASIVSSMNVTIGLQRMVTCDRTDNVSTMNDLQQSPLVRQLVDKDHSKTSMEYLVNLNFGVIYTKMSSFTESGSENQGVLYTFPRSKSKNVSSVLFSTKGAFVTLNHMLPENIGFHPVSTSISVSNESIHVTYHSFQDELLLIAYPDKRCSKAESTQLSADVVRTLSFINESISKCFLTQSNHLFLDHFFSLFFMRIVSKQSCIANANSTTENVLNTKTASNYNCEFETILPAAQFIHLPRDAQIQIDAALNEMEAMDYRDWNEDPMDCQRLYTILGSCLYHKNYLLGSHLSYEMCIQVHSFLRQNGLLNLISNEAVKSLVIWKKVYPSSSLRSDSEQIEGQLFLQEQCFLLIVGYGNDILAVLLESGGSTAEYEENTGPDIFYVEEAQETLLHIQKIGIPMLAEKWISANAKPEIVPFDECSITKTSVSLTENLLSFIKSTDSQSMLTKSNVNMATYRKSQDGINYLKQRNLEDNTVKSGSVYSLQTSEESLSQGTGAVSEISDEAAPILGRRATREKINITSKHSEDSDSDLDVYRNESQASTMDISDIRENLLNQAEYITPKRLTTSRDKNYLFHYVHFDLFEGILLSSYINRELTRNIKFITNFNRCANVIHQLLQNTMRFKKMLNQDVDKSVINKSLIAIKEHGVLFEWENMAFWVVGRLYTVPQAKELYVCYDESAPQNLIEIAFRLNAMCT